MNSLAASQLFVAADVAGLALSWRRIGGRIAVLQESPRGP